MRITQISLCLALLLGSTSSSFALAELNKNATTTDNSQESAASKEHDKNAQTHAQRAYQLSPVIVESSFEDVYLQPVAETSVSAEQFQIHHNGNINQMLRDSAGTYTLEDPTNPGIAVNIRGLSGYGRVNTMIDGVPQTFRNAHGHAAYGGTRLYVQPELISGTDITRGAVSGADGSGSLMGAANFKTLEAEDVITGDKNWGVIGRVKAGSNGMDGSYMGGAAAKTKFLEGSASIVAAWAKSRQGIYKNGHGETDYKEGQGNSVSNPKNDPKGGLVKVELKPNDEHAIKIGYVNYQNTFSSNYRWNLKNKTLFLNYAYTPGNDWFDTRFNLYRNNTKMHYDAQGGGSYAERDAKAISKGGDLSNTSRFNFADNWNGKVEYGFSFQEDQYDVTSPGANQPGTLKKESFFTDLTLSKGIFSATAGLRYDHWDLEGVRQARTQGTGGANPNQGGSFTGNACPSGPENCPAENVKRSGHKLNPKITVAVTPTDWMQLYTTYSHTYRPPTAQEAFWGLVPFGKNNGSGIFNNLDLKPETSKGFDLGVNLYKRHIFMPDDHAYMKINYYDYRVENFITNDMVDIDRAPGDDINYIPSPIWVNMPGKTKLSGFEIEAGYDAGIAYANLAYTQAKTKTPMGWSAGMHVQSDWLPKHYYTLDAGVRLFDQKLVLGGKMRYTSSSEYAKWDYQVGKQPSYKIFDLYGSYEINRNSQAFFTIENVTNRAYRVAQSGEGPGTDETGRGRTLNVGININF